MFKHLKQGSTSRCQKHEYDTPYKIDYDRSINDFSAQLNELIHILMQIRMTKIYLREGTRQYETNCLPVKYILMMNNSPVCK